ncbi:hypothetical protein ACUN7V_14745 [Quadrisphaera oryzae]|uniref:hypothetical protein n=1 Tax=Quadrisphaera TaxID=317661 RepID=UPI00164727CF|nr:hypothetical protein [Quadrisphaera sp. RL12-1S]MBC3763182.1 hypothetical protein [Quadrisphaera sp. RL12-1S]
MSTPSFIDRLRSRSRRPEQVSLLGAVPPPLVETSPGPLVAPAPALALPEDHWHAGDPRLAPGATSLQAPSLHAPELPSPRRPVDRRGLHVVPEVDLRGEVVDLRGADDDAVTAADAVLPAPPTTRLAPEREAPCTEPSTWLG